MNAKSLIGGLISSAGLSYLVMLILRPDETKIESMDKSFKNTKSKVSHVDVLKAAAQTDKPLYMLSKKEIEELVFPKSDK